MKDNWPWDHVYVLNLDKDLDKWENMKIQLKKLNIKAERFSAIYGLEKFKYGKEIMNTDNTEEKWNLIEKMNESLKKDGHVSELVGNKYPYMRPGELGHLNSFLKVFQDALKKNYQKILILEDDCQFIDNFKKEFYKSYNQLPNDWSLFYLGVNQFQLDSTPKPIKIKNNICKLHGVNPKKKPYKKGGIYGTHAMLLKRRAIKEWLVKAYPFVMASDIVMGKLINQYKRIKGYYPCKQLISETSTMESSTTRKI